MGPGGYSPEALAERLLQALQAGLSARPEISKLVVVGCSLGGTVTLRTFMDEDLRQRYAGVLDKVAGFVLFAPSDVLITSVTDSWNSFFTVNGFKAGVGSALGILQYKVVQSTLESLHQQHLVSREVAESAIRVVSQRKYREATQAIMRDAVHWSVFREHADF